MGMRRKSIKIGSIIVEFDKVGKRTWDMNSAWKRRCLNSFRIDMKTVKVVAAVICDSIKEKKLIFATARGYGESKGQWEFPGGKIEPGETPQEALVREIKEELDTLISVGDLIDTVEYDYPSFHLSMDCFWCEVIEGELKLLEAEDAKWLNKGELDSVQWLPADITLISKVKAFMK